MFCFWFSEDGFDFGCWVLIVLGFDRIVWCSLLFACDLFSDGGGFPGFFYISFYGGWIVRILMGVGIIVLPNLNSRS